MFIEGETVVLNQSAKSGLPMRIGEVCEIIENLYNNAIYDYRVAFSDGEFAKVKESELNKLTDKQRELITYLYQGNKVLYTPTNEILKIIKTDYLHHLTEVEDNKLAQFIVHFDNLIKIEKEIGSVAEFKFKVGETVKIISGDEWKYLNGLVLDCYRDGTDINSYEVAVGDSSYPFGEHELELYETSNESQKDELGYFAELGLEVGKLVDEKQKAYGDSVTKCYEIMKVLLQDYHNEDTHTYTIPESLLEIMLLDVRKIDKLNRRFSNPDGDLMNENSFKDDVGYSLLGMRMVDNAK